MAPATLLGFFINFLFGGPAIDLSALPPIYTLIPLFIIFAFTAGLGEELGWRGFLLPRLQAKYSALISSVIIGTLWGLWHFPLFMIDFEGFPYFSLAAKLGFIPAMLGFIIVNQIPWSILYTWVYNNTKGSVLLICFFHASEVWVRYFTTGTNYNMNDPFTYFGYGIVMLAASVIVILLNGPENLSKTKRQTN